MHALLLLSLSLLPCQGMPAQQPISSPTFSVATIKPSAPEVTSPMTQFQGRRFVTQGTTFIDLFKYAFDVHPSQIVGGPDWLSRERFDVVADPEMEQRPSSDQMKAMMRQLLTERFHVTMHQEQKPLAVYAIVKINAEPKLTKTTADPNNIPTAGFLPRGELHVGNASMKNFATFLQRFAVDRPVIDETGISGRFDLTLRWTPENLRLNGKLVEPSADPNAPPELFTAFQEQLGLKLKATRAPTDVFVIDHAERPSVD